MEKSYCAGCHDEPYHFGLGGSRECWSFKKAKLVWRKEVSIHQCPPFNQKARKLPDCYHRPQYCYIDGNKTGW